MNIKSSVALAALLIVIAGGVYYLSKHTTLLTPVTPAAIQPSLDGGQWYSWSFKDNGYNEETFANSTTVTLTVRGKAYDVGTYNGNCAEIDTEALDENQTTGVLCWWAGAGDEIGIFAENGKLVIKHGEHEEPTAETEGFRGNFKTLVELR